MINYRHQPCRRLGAEGLTVREQEGHGGANFGVVAGDGWGIVVATHGLRCGSGAVLSSRLASLGQPRIPLSRWPIGVLLGEIVDEATRMGLACSAPDQIRSKLITVVACPARAEVEGDGEGDQGDHCWTHDPT